MPTDRAKVLVSVPILLGSVVDFVDGHVALLPICFDGHTPAYLRDPIPGYAYRYSGN